MSYPKKPIYFNKSKSIIKTRLVSFNESKRNQLEKIILNRLKNKYSYGFSPNIESYAKEEVNKFTNSRNPKSRQISLLERNISEKIYNSVNRITTADRKYELPKLDTSTNLLQNVTLVCPSTNPNSNRIKDSWHKILDYNKLVYEKERKQAEENYKKKKYDTSKLLQEQIMLKQHKLNLSVIENKKYDQMLIDSVKLQEKDAQKKEKELKEKILKEKEIRDNQLKQFNERKEKQLQDKKERENKIIEKIKKEIEEEKGQIKLKKDKMKQTMIEVITDNLNAKAALEDRKKKEKEMDLKLQNEYEKIMILQEEKRNKEIKDREHRIQNLVNIASDGYIKKSAAKQKEEELLELKYWQLKEEKEKKEEKTRIEKQKKLEKNTFEFLSNQINERKILKEKEKIENKEYINSLQCQIDLENKKEAEKQEKQKQKIKNVYSEIKSQIDSKKKYNEDEMSEMELKMNKKLLDLATIELGK